MLRASAPLILLALLSTTPANAQTDEEVAARLTAEVHSCEKSPENGGTLEQAFCYKDEAVRQDKKLNKTWISLMGRVTTTRQVVLRRSERRWIKERDGDCHKAASDYINSTYAYMFNVCVVDETIRRTMWLEQVK